MARFWELAHLTDNLRTLRNFDGIPQAPGLYIGGVSAFYPPEGQPDPLGSAGITHVLSVTDFPFQDPARIRAYKHFHLHVADQENENLLKHFDRTYDFIDSALTGGGSGGGGGAVFVHCALGISRSATVVTAYLMRKFGLSADEALARLREGRPRCRPNEGFLRQLRVYGEMLRAPDYAGAAAVYETWLEGGGRDAGVKL